MYWLHLEAPVDVTLDDLDSFLRDVWLECCGHLSAFTIGGVSYSASPEDLGWWREERSTNVKLGKVLHVGDEFLHEYDFGSTTYLKLKVVAEYEGPPRGRDIEVMAQNAPPPIPCSACGQPATQVCSMCSWEAEGWLCDACGKEHECGEDMFLPVVNSPRVGVCGYTG
jgi:hypothetical protein